MPPIWRRLSKSPTFSLPTKRFLVFKRFCLYWRNWLKGTFDLHRDKHKILVTGSARLDFYSRGGDSLVGRYFFHRLHPFTLSELLNTKTPDIEKIPELEVETNLKDSKNILDELLKLGGFPEPFCSGSELESSRWRSIYGTRLIREDIRDLERIFDLDKMELLYDLDKKIT